MKSRVFGFLLVSLSVAVLGAPAEPARAKQAARGGPVKFHLSFQKTEYKRTDPLEVTFSLENTGKQAMWVNARFFLAAESEPRREVVLRVTGPKGETLPCTRTDKTGFPKTEFFKLLEPGKTETAEYPRDLRNYFDVAAPGRYTVVGVYENGFGQEIGLEAFRGPVESAPVSLTIIE